MSGTERSNSPAPTVLMVEDEILVRLALADELRDAGLFVLEAGSADQAMAILSDRPDIQLVCTDLRMPGETDGVGLARWIKQSMSIPVVIVTGEHRTDDLTAFADLVLTKPLLDTELVAGVLELLNISQRVGHERG